MLDLGNILYFNIFHFKNAGTAPKPKYFVVIKHIDNMTLLASLPSSQKHLPTDLHAAYGCLELPDSGIGCYALKAHTPVATNGFAFSLDSYLYGQHLDEYYAENIADLYPLESIDYEIKGQLLPDILEDIITCFKNSAAVKRRFKRYLADF
jgi:hypothetical protein